MSARQSRKDLNTTSKQSACKKLEFNEKTRHAAPALPAISGFTPVLIAGVAGAAYVTTVLMLVLLFTSLFAIPLARQSCLYAFLFTGLQVVGVTLDFLDDVLLLYLPLKSAQRIFERFAFLNTNLSQKIPPPNPPTGISYDTGNIGPRVKYLHISL
jgi:hypothetical protein